MNTPNKLSLFRVILVPILVLVYVFPYEQYAITFPKYTIGEVILTMKDIIILIIFIIASFTDFLDGYIARKYKLITSFGKFIDPIADKLLVNTLFIMLAYTGEIWLVPVLIMIWRDTLVDGMRMMSAQKGVVVAAGIWGKAKTVLQMAAIIVALLRNLPFALIGIPMVEILVVSACMVSVISGYRYFMQTRKYIMESK